MGARGRKSTAALGIANPSSVSAITRIGAPNYLTDEQSVVWRSIANRMPADWLQAEVEGVLAQYCRHVVAAGRVAQLINVHESKDKIDVNEYDQLLKMQEREGRALSSLATRLRITPQATVNHKKKKGTVSEKPWK